MTNLDPCCEPQHNTLEPEDVAMFNRLTVLMKTNLERGLVFAEFERAHSEPLQGLQDWFLASIQVDTCLFLCVDCDLTNDMDSLTRKGCNFSILDISKNLRWWRSWDRSNILNLWWASFPCNGGQESAVFRFSNLYVRWRAWLRTERVLNERWPNVVTRKVVRSSVDIYDLASGVLLRSQTSDWIIVFLRSHTSLLNTLPQKQSKRTDQLSIEVS